MNRLIDDVIHPFFDDNPELILLDTILHGFVERNPKETTMKFVQYSLPKIVKALTKSTR